MQLIDGRPVYSATDLVGFLACEHLTNLERAAVARLVERPNRDDPELDRIAKRGEEHERRFLAGLVAEGRSVTEIKEDKTIADRGERLRKRAAQTLDAMRRGDDVIYQAAFFDGTWLGFADFLVKVDGADGADREHGEHRADGADGEHPMDAEHRVDAEDRVRAASHLGPWSYEAWDTKLARHTKGSAVLQLSLYSDLLGRLQGRQPERMHVALGGSQHAIEHFRTADYAAYYRLVRRMFEEAVGAGEPSFPPPTRPDPVEHCEVCRWSVDCARERRRTDDLSLVANITGRQRRALRERGVETRRALATLELPMQPPLHGTSPDALSRTRDQAAIQVRGDDAGRTIYELLQPSRTREGELELDRGLLSLPAPSKGDLFFDIEGDPFAFDDG
ncbi:MAG TPA: TM0106 family RecB-like putative nuclease, partial [Candidatus Limnocylindrales bacterium]